MIRVFRMVVGPRADCCSEDRRNVTVIAETMTEALETVSKEPMTRYQWVSSVQEWVSDHVLVADGIKKCIKGE